MPPLIQLASLFSAEHKLDSIHVYDSVGADSLVGDFWAAVWQTQIAKNGLTKQPKGLAGSTLTALRRLFDKNIH